MYIIIELQTTNNQTSNIVTTKNTKDEAMSVYYSILAAAAISNVEYHTAAVMDKRGRCLASECFEHLQIVTEEVDT